MIDLQATLTSGQVFRFAMSPRGWEGVDGEHVYVLNDDVLVAPSASLASFLRLDWDYGEEFARLTESPELSPLLEGCRGLRLLRPSCPREALFSFLCTSNNHIARITKMVACLANLGEELGPGARRFPALERIVDLTEADLRCMGFGYRAKTLPQVARDIVGRGGERWFQSLRRASYPDVVRELLTLPGVGPKLADCIALYAFDKTEAVPVDTHLWQAYVRAYRADWTDLTLTAARYREVGEHLRERHGDRAALAQQILFYSNLTRRKVKANALDLPERRAIIQAGRA